MRALGCALVIAAFVSAAPAWAKITWVGKTVILKKSGAVLVRHDAQGQPLPPLIIRFLQYNVVAEEHSRLKVVQEGMEGWLEKLDVILLEDALEFFNKALEENPTSDLYNRRAGTFRSREKYDEAIQDFTEAIRLQPNSKVLVRNRGSAQLAKKDYEKALADLNESLRLDPNDFLSYAIRGDIYNARKEFDLAIADFTNSLNKNPKQARAVSGRATAYAGQKNYTQAQSDWEEAIRMDAQYGPAYNGLAWMWATCPDARFRNGPKALAHAQFALKYDGGSSGVVDTIAAAYAECGQFDKAIYFQEQALLDRRSTDQAEMKQRLELYKKKEPYRQK